MSFNEHALELSFIEFLQNKGYIHQTGSELIREKSEVLIVEDLKEYLRTRYASDELTESEINSIILSLRTVGGTLYEANKTIMSMIVDGFVFNREDRDKKDVFIELLNYEEPEKNIFKIVNQLEIEGYNYQIRIPDGIIYVNGLPLVVLEFKTAIQENTTIMDAYTQLTVRYQRDIPEIFKYNAFVVISDGANSKYGSLFTQYEFFYAWRKVNDDDTEMDGINSLFTMIDGLFVQDRLLAVVKNFIYFPDSTDSNTKVVCRYPQFFAANNLYENVKAHMKPNGDGKGGTYFGTTGCGKSYTMLFLTRMIMKSSYFKSPTILIITDRTDLDDQLSKQFVASKQFIGDNNIISIESRDETDRYNVICISDEAHRSQINLDMKVKITDDGVNKTYGFAKYLHDSLPNATYIGFTGTPIDATVEVFGDIVGHPYTMTEAVKDEITVNLVYDGRAAKVTLREDKLREIEE